jgi:hypothetical protein
LNPVDFRSKPSKSKVNAGAAYPGCIASEVFLFARHLGMPGGFIMFAQIIPSLMGWRFFRLLLWFLCSVCLFVGLHAYMPATQAAQIQQARVTQVLDSNQVYIQNRQARVNDRAKQGERVRTGRARAQLSFNTGAVARLAYNSVLTVGQCAQLKQGTLLVSGVVSGCTPSVVAGVRGTTYVLEVNEAGQTQVKVLEGKVAVRRNSATNLKFLLSQVTSGKQNSSAEVLLSAGEKLAVSSTGVFGTIEQLTQLDFVTLLTGSLFQDFKTPIPGIDKVRQSFERLFPGVPFPVELIPNLPSIPSVPVPRIPGLPF